MAAHDRWARPERDNLGHDERWTKVDEYNLSHLHPKGAYPDLALMDRILESSNAAGLPPIAVSPALGKFLQLQARMLRAKTIVEVGMLGGYSTIWLASSHPGVRITSVEINADYAELAKKHFDQAGVSDRIEVVVGSGLDRLPELVQEVKDGKRPKVDLAFIDANKENNLEYFNSVMEMVRPGACVIVDNVVRQGKVVDPSKFDEPAVKGTKRLIEAVGKDTRVDATILQLVAEKNYDGFMIATVKDE